jgi:YqaJ-like viral recombinase domain
MTITQQAANEWLADHTGIITKTIDGDTFVLVECLQGTPEWLQLRAGVVTASRFSDAISVLSRASGNKKAGDPTSASDRYAHDLAIERIYGLPFGEPPKAWVLDRGHELEAKARIAYEVRTGHLVQEAGLVLSSEREFGYSTDGFINDDGMIEVKCPIDGTKIVEMWATGDVSEYIHQIQGGLWLTGRKWCDFIMYVPALENVGKDLFIKRIYRDEAFIEDMETRLVAFNRRVIEAERILRLPIAA